MSRKMNWRAARLRGNPTLDARREFETPDRAAKWLAGAKRRLRHRRQCKECVKIWWRSLSNDQRTSIGNAQRSLGKKRRHFAPDWIFHSSSGRLCEKHQAAANAWTGKRRARKINATPAWADQSAIRAIYREAQRLTRQTGRKMHVDHIIPLNGRNVSGLRVETNLQILPATDNVKKSNKFVSNA